MFERLLGKAKTVDKQPKIGETWKMEDLRADDPWPRKNDVVAVILDVREGWVRYALRREDNIHSSFSGMFQDQRKTIADFMSIYKFYRNLVDFPVASSYHIDSHPRNQHRS